MVPNVVGGNQSSKAARRYILDKPWLTVKRVSAKKRGLRTNREIVCIPFPPSSKTLVCLGVATGCYRLLVRIRCLRSFSSVDCATHSSIVSAPGTRRISQITGVKLPLAANVQSEAKLQNR